MSHFECFGVRLFALTVSCCSLGCGLSGPEGPARAITFGKVTFNGQPIANGMIRFIPNDGPAAQGQIKDGSYHINYKGGVPVSVCRVEIEAFKAGSEKVVISADGKTAYVAVQFLPDTYNINSTLQAEISPDEENERNFKLSGAEENKPNQR